MTIPTATAFVTKFHKKGKNEFQGEEKKRKLFS